MMNISSPISLSNIVLIYGFLIYNVNVYLVKRINCYSEKSYLAAGIDKSPQALL